MGRYGDFNSDGKMDIAVTNATDNTVSVLLGNGDGTFQSRKTFAVGTDPNYVATGDFNADGITDLAVVNELSLSVSILLGNGDGTFLAAKGYTTGMKTLPLWAAVGDFIGNGKLDLAIASSSSNSVQVLLGKGDGTFTLPVAYTAGTSPSAVTMGDFNGDGVQDLAVANSKSSNVSIFLGVGNGTFGAATNFATAITPLSVIAGDFNGDGKLDLALGYSTLGSDNGVSILMGNGDGTFQNHVDHTTGLLDGGPTEAVTAADFNGDGDMDVVAADQIGNIISTFLNTPLAGVAPPSLNFGVQLLKKPSPTKTLTVTNSGSATLNVSSVSTTGDYSQTNTCTAAILPGGTCSVSVIFTPTVTGTRSGSITLNDNAPSASQVISATGIGTAVQLAPSSLTFGTQKVGTKRSPKNVTLTNTGTSALAITSITLTGLNPLDFTQTNTCGTSVAAGRPAPSRSPSVLPRLAIAQPQSR